MPRIPGTREDPQTWLPFGARPRADPVQRRGRQGAGGVHLALGKPIGEVLKEVPSPLRGRGLEPALSLPKG